MSITLDLLRKKAEHHDGLLEELEEISLHQLKLERIELLGRVAPRLKIIYLQNNLISKIGKGEQAFDTRRRTFAFDAMLSC